MDFSSRRTASPYDALAGRATPVEVAGGVSAYFTSPTESLDPGLFTPDERLHPPIRRWLLDTYYGWMRQYGFNDAPKWAIPWIAGSAISYQWSADRDPGDLDILIGIDYVQFRQDNPRYAQLSDVQIGDAMNERMKADLWPKTDRISFGGPVPFEVTWYVNPHSTDIRSINPYAAYNLVQDEWTVRPIELPAGGPGEWFPKEWHAAADADAARTKGITARYNKALADYAAAQGHAQRRNALAAVQHAVNEGVALFDEIHLGRHQAFSAEGQGYRDWNNFRWQAGKARGTTKALHAIKTAQREAAKAAQAALYGNPLADADTVLRKALGG